MYTTNSHFKKNNGDSPVLLGVPYFQINHDKPIPTTPIENHGRLSSYDARFNHLTSASALGPGPSHSRWHGVYSHLDPHLRPSQSCGERYTEYILSILYVVTCSHVVISYQAGTLELRSCRFSLAFQPLVVKISVESSLMRFGHVRYS